MSGLALQRWRQLTEILPAGTRLTDATVLEVVVKEDGCLVLFQQGRSPWTYGVTIGLTDVRHEYYYGPRFPVASWNEWLESFPTNLMVDLDTGLVAASARTAQDGYVELDPSTRWPSAPDIDFDVWDQQPEPRHRPEIYLEGLRIDWTDPRLVFAVRGVVSAGRAMVDVVAVVTNTEEEGVVRVETRARAGTARRHALECLHTACHLAEMRGARRVVTSIETPDADVLGFRMDQQRRWLAADTTFFDEDFERATVGQTL